MRRTVAITGASGFIGLRLIEYLVNEGWHIKALQRQRPIISTAGANIIETISGDMTDQQSLEDLVEGADAVIHLAGLIKAKNDDEFFTINSQGVKHLTAAIKNKTATTTLIMASSLAAREPSLSNYAKSKRMGEDILVETAPKIDWTILRPPAVYGPGDRQTLAFFRAAKNGFGPMLGDKNARFSLLYVDDLISAITMLLSDRRAHQRILELDDGTPEGHSWRSMTAAAGRQLGVAIRPVSVPKTALVLAGRSHDILRRFLGINPMLTHGKIREILHPDWVADNRDIAALSDWRPALGMDRGFAATVAWYQQHRWL